MGKALLVTLLFPALASCISKHGGKTVWDDTGKCFEISQTSLLYAPPTDKDSWIIADNENLTEKIIFCGVDTTSHICVAVVNTDSDRKNIASMDSAAVLKLVWDITCQYPPESIIKYDRAIKRCIYNGSESWRFDTGISVKDRSDTVTVSNCGYFFENDNAVLGIVVTVPGIVARNMKETEIEKYLTGLTLDAR